MNPYLVLGVSLSADDGAIRQAYLEAIRLTPPDLAPARFTAVSAAYQQIKDEASRHHYTLFDRSVAGDSPIDAFARGMRGSAGATPLPFDVMKSFLKSCAKI